MKMRLHRSLYRILSPLAALLLLSLLLAFTGCGGAKSADISTDPTNPPAATVSISASPASIAAGATSTLTVTAANATTVKVTGSDGSSYTLPATGGTQAVTPAATTTYTATATGAGGNATATATVTVIAPAAPTVQITANPTSIAAGSTSTLTVTATNATAVTVTGSDGSKYTLSANGGTQSVTPTATTTYTATATGAGGNATATATLTVTKPSGITVTIVASPTAIIAGADSTLTVTAAGATAVTVSGSDGSNYTFPSEKGGKHTVTPSTTTTYTAEATSAAGKVSDTATVTITAPESTKAINHVIFMMQENHTFDNYFGMLNKYRRDKNMNTGEDGHVYTVDGIDDKLNTTNKTDEGVSIPLYKFKSSCIDDATSDWLASYGDVNRYNFLASRPIALDGFVHNAEGFAKNCALSLVCSGDFTDTAGQRAMGYYDEDFLNYYYYMASQFAVSDRWFSPIAAKSNPNRVATFTGGTTQGLVFDQGYDDHIGSLSFPNIFHALEDAHVSWRVYYSDTAGQCGIGDDDCGGGDKNYPATALGYITYTKNYLYPNPTHAACTGTTQPSSVVGDSSNYFCIDTNHVAPLRTYYSDITNGMLPSFAFIEPGYGINDEHPGSFQPVLLGQQQMAKIINAFMTSSAWKDSVFFFSYDEGGGPYDHVPPVPKHSNDKTTASDKPNYPVDIASISVSPDKYKPCVPDTPPATTHCDLRTDSPGAHSGDAAAVNGFGAQIGFRVPNIVISPFTRRHYVSHVPMDHTAIIKFIEDRFIGDGKYLTSRDAAQPSLLDFFDFSRTPWATPPTPPVPASNSTLGRNTCTPSSM
ncbi:MAG TPA: alkaline phosphatase family protein [Edaphobacter sp.]|nr:alkaline phosphatase family protein [Edaphobacter sp.]